MTPINRLDRYMDDNRDHPHCCNLKRAAENDLERAWEDRETAKNIRDAAARLDAESKARGVAADETLAAAEQMLSDAEIHRTLTAIDRDMWHRFAWFCVLSVLLHLALVLRGCSL